MSRLNGVAAEVNAALGEYRFDEAANAVYRFFWGDFCDWYLEIVKLRLDFADADSSQNGASEAPAGGITTLLQVFEAALRLLSPFMPFITEELWHALYDGNAPAKSIALTRYPQADRGGAGCRVEAEMATLQELIVTLRGLRKELDVPEREELRRRFSGRRESNLLRRRTGTSSARLARVSSVSSLRRGRFLPRIQGQR